jgi:hypothetical protein
MARSKGSPNSGPLSPSRAELEKKLALLKVRELAARDLTELLPVWIEMRPLVDQLQKRFPRSPARAGDPVKPPRRYGPKGTLRENVRRKMRAMDRDELGAMKGEAMAITFGASRGTCDRARKEVLKE